MEKYLPLVKNVLKRLAFALPVFMIGLTLINAGNAIQVPSDYLTTYSFQSGTKIREYVGGDAYNFIIGASLVGGEISGKLAAKAIYDVGGKLLMGLSVLVFATVSFKEKGEAVKAEGDESQAEKQAETPVEAELPETVEETVFEEELDVAAEEETQQRTRSRSRERASLNEEAAQPQEEMPQENEAE